MSQMLAESLWRQRLAAFLLAAFAALAVLLAGAGIYSVFSYLVNRRVKELGVRLALGATRRQLMALVLGSALKLSALGILIGILVALAAGRLISARATRIDSPYGSAPGISPFNRRIVPLV